MEHGAGRRKASRAELRRKPLPSVPATETRSPSPEANANEKHASATGYQLVPARTETRQAVPTSAWSRARSFCSRTWAWEIAAVALSFGCIAAIVGVLTYENGKPLSQWSLSIAPGAVVAFLASLCKGSLMVAVVEIISQLKWLHFSRGPQRTTDLQLFDEASRGPWGSIKLIALKHVRTLPACLGALITIAALFVDPAVQLVLSFPTELRSPPGSSALFSTTRIYDPNHVYTDVYPVPIPSLVDVSMQGSIYSGLYGSLHQDGLSCLATECSWTNVTTLGVCSSCDDLTSTIQTSCEAGGGEDGWGQTCTYQVLPGSSLQGFVMMTGSSIDRHPIRTVWNSTSINFASEKTKTGDQPYLASFLAIKLPLGSDLGDTATLPPPQAMACGFYLCAKTYASARFANNSATLSTAVETNVVLESDVAFGGTYLTVDMIADPSSPWAGGQTFSMNRQDFIDIGQYLADIFGTSSITDGRGVQNMSAGTGPDGSAALSNAVNVTALLANVSESMTGAVRTCANHTAAAGSALAPVTVVRVQFAWLALPVALAGLATVLLGVVAWSTRRAGEPLWRSSSVAVLVHRLDGLDGAQMGRVSEARDTFQLHAELGDTRTFTGYGAGSKAFVKRGPERNDCKLYWNLREATTVWAMCYVKAWS